jgi:hypothetical protein
MKTTSTKKLLAFIITVMFPFTFVSAQCPGNKILVYKCSTITFGCHSRCGYPNNSWLPFCPCEGRPANERSSLANEPVDGKLFTLAVSPNPVSGLSVIYFFLEQSEKVSLNIFDVNGRLVSTLADKIFEEGENDIVWNAADVNAGIYFLRFETASYSKNRKLIVAK